MQIHANGCIQDSKGKFVYIGSEYFLNEICKGKACFICGATNESKEFNKEHILPAWLLKLFKVQNERILLPNGTKISYPEYLVPCCKDCNSLMSAVFETPLSKMLRLSFSEFTDCLKSPGNYQLLVCWLHLIFLKTHLKDTELRLHRDERKPAHPISSLFDLYEIHHVHAVARSFYTNARIDESVLPALHIFQAKEGFNSGFDYADLCNGMAMMMRLGEIILIVAFNDSGMASAASEPILRKIKDNLDPVQAREILARIAYGNMLLIERPIYRTEYDSSSDSVTIVGDLPKTLKLHQPNYEQFGELLYYLLSERLEKLDIDREKSTKEVRSGRFTFIV